MQNLFSIKSELILNNGRNNSELLQNKIGIYSELMKKLFWLNAEFILEFM